MSIKSRVSLSLILISATLVGSTFYSVPSYAATTNNASGAPGLFGNPGTGSSMFSLGALLGFGFLSAGGGTQLVVGVNGDYKIMPNVSVGGYFTYDSIAATAPASGSLITVAPEANYHFDGQLTGFRVGGKVGLGFINASTGSTTPLPGTTTGSTSSTTTSLLIGPHIGYDYPIMSAVSFGGEGNILFYTANGGFNAVNFLANLKYWF